jgi:SAM-dependent methyltransferase
MDYYRHLRPEIEPLLPCSAARVLDVGAGTGATLRWIKEAFPKSQVTGVEPAAEAAEALGLCADAAFTDTIEDALPRLGTFDLILLLDVLEHLRDPELVLRQLVARLEPGGCILVSLPNVAHLSVSLPLLLRGRFEYQDSGILDRTHLHFFVESTAINLMNRVGLTVMDGVATGLEGPKSRLLAALSLGTLRSHLTKQYVMRAQPMNGLAQGQVRWRRVNTRAAQGIMRRQYAEAAQGLEPAADNAASAGA